MKEGPLGARKPHEPSRMILHGRVTVDDVLAALVGRGPRIESSTGQQLEQARALHTTEQGDMHASAPSGDVWQAMDRAEHAIGKDVGTIRCLDMLARARSVSSGSSHASLGALLTLHAATQRGKGELVILVLLAYHEWALHSKERALAEVYALARRLKGGHADASTLAHEFRTGKATDARKLAARLYGDSLIVLGEHVQRWNRKRSESVRDH